MKLVIQGKNIEITDAIRDYVNQKIEKAVNHYESLTLEVDVHLSVAKNPRITPQQTAEVTIYASGTIIRAEYSSENLYASIDMVADKISRRLRKYKEKRSAKRASASIKQVPVAALDPGTGIGPEVIDDLLQNGQPALPGQVVRTKYFSMPPMSVEDALEQLQLVGHDFFMFRNLETGDINVVYKRNHGGCGLLLPREPGAENGAKNGFSSSSVNGHRAHGNHQVIPAAAKMLG